MTAVPVPNTSITPEYLKSLYDAVRGAQAGCEAYTAQALDSAEVLALSDHLLFPPTPEKKVIAFASPFAKIGLGTGNPAQLLQKYADSAGIWEAMIWENKKPVTFNILPNGFVEVTITDDSGSFCYTPLCPESSEMVFGEKVLHIHQEVTYHLHDRCINTWYLVPTSDEDLINTRTLSEWTPPFKQNGIIIFMLRQYWQVRAYNAPTALFVSQPDPNKYPDTGFANTPFRASSRAIPSTPWVNLSNGTKVQQYHSYDNGQIEEFGKLHPIDFYISKKRIKIVENGFVKVDYPVDLNFNKCTVMPAMGSYHMVNKIQDLKNQEAAGNGHETGYFDLAMQDKRTFGPLEMEILEAIP